MTDDCIQKCEEFLKMLRNEKQPKKQIMPSQQNRMVSKGPGTKPRIQRPCMQHINSPQKSTVSNLKVNSTWEGLLTKNTNTTPKSSARTNHSSLDQSQRNISSNNDINFMQFDPVHTIQFLTLELKSRLNKLLPDDTSVHKILSEMQQTIKRLTNTKNTSSSNFLNLQSSILGNHIKDKELEKLEKSYDNIKMDRELLIKELNKNRNEIIFLKKENKFLEEKLKMEEILSNEKNSKNSLEEQYKRLQVEIKNLQQIIDNGGKQNKDTAIINELNLKLKNSFEKIEELENKSLEYDKNLIFSKMEKEKLKILLNSRENQIHDIQKELSDIQNLVHEQLDTIKNDIILEMPSNNSNHNNNRSTSNDLNFHKNNQHKKKGFFSNNEKQRNDDHFPEKDNQLNSIELQENMIDKKTDTISSLSLDEFRKMLGDVTIPSPPRNFRSFSLQNFDNSFDTSQIISSTSNE